MRRFLVSSCCVIVALQVLVGVPLAVCIGFLSMIELPGAPVAAAPVVWVPQPVDLPAALPPANCETSPAATSEPAVLPPAKAPEPVRGLQLRQDVQYLLESPTAPESVRGLQPIVESRARHGSPLADSCLAASSPSEDLRQFVATLQEVATTEGTQPQLPLPAEPEPDQPTAAPASGDQRPPHDSPCLLSSLYASVEQLYALCQRLEADQEYGRADQVRRLARDIRSEIDLIRQGEARLKSVGWDPPQLPAARTIEATVTEATVTEASFNPEPPLVPAPDAPPPPVPTEPTPGAPPTQAPAVHSAVPQQNR